MKNFAAIFPGQGSQHPGMGKEFYDNFSVAKQTYEEASDAIRVDMRRLCFEGTDADLKLTANTQPALLVTSIAAWRVFKSECGLQPQMALGHSLGEYSALVAAEGLTLADAMMTVRLRGQAMQDAVPAGTGGMVALLGMEDSQVTKACLDILSKSQAEGVQKGWVLEPANFNTPGQVVVSGHLKALEYMKTHLVGADYGAPRVKFIPLAVSAPFHCSLMVPAAHELKPQLEKVKWAMEMKFPVVHNVNGEQNKSGSGLKQLLVDQITKSVLWAQSVNNCHKWGIPNFVEFGAGRILTGMLKKINPDTVGMNVDTIENLKNTMTNLKGTN